MQKIILNCMFGIAITLLSFNASAKEADKILGQWFSEDEVSKILVTQKDGVYSGKIISLADPNYEKGDKEAGKPKRDRENPEKKLRKAPIVGLHMLKGFKYNSGDKAWDGGTIYDPDKGKTYKCVIKYEVDKKVRGGEKLMVRGYVGIPALGRTTEWTRVPEDELEELED